MTYILHSYNPAPSTPYADRAALDWYPSPLPLCRAIIATIPALFRPARILDPGAGSGPFGQAARERWSGAHLIGVEARPVGNPGPYDEWFSGESFCLAPTPKPPKRGKNQPDAAWERAVRKFEEQLELSRLPVCEFLEPFDLITGNPPYSDAEPFIRKSLSLLRPGGLLVFLLRLAFLESKDRAEGLWSEFGPVTVDTLAERPSFIPEGDKAGNTDSAAYGLFIWQAGHYPARYSGGWLQWRGQATAVAPATPLPLFGAVAA